MIRCSLDNDNASQPAVPYFVGPWDLLQANPKYICHARDNLYCDSTVKPALRSAEGTEANDLSQLSRNPQHTSNQPPNDALRRDIHNSRGTLYMDDDTSRSAPLHHYAERAPFVDACDSLRGPRSKGPDSYTFTLGRDEAKDTCDGFVIGGDPWPDSFQSFSDDSVLSEESAEINTQISGLDFLDIGWAIGPYTARTGASLSTIPDSTEQSSYASESWTVLTDLDSSRIQLERDGSFPSKTLNDLGGTWAGGRDDLSTQYPSPIPMSKDNVSPTTRCKTERGLLESMNTESKTSRFECPNPNCPVSFQRPCDLRKHEQKHKDMDKRDFGCEACSRRFTTRRDLGRHLLTHADRTSGTTRFFCRELECRKRGISFLRKDQCDSHIRKVHERQGRDTYTCNICGVGFGSMHDRRRHEASVHNVFDRVYRCGVTTCKRKDKLWKRRDNLKYHVEIQHGVEGADVWIEIADRIALDNVPVSVGSQSGPPAAYMFTFNTAQVAAQPPRASPAKMTTAEY